MSIPFRSNTAAPTAEIPAQTPAILARRVASTVAPALGIPHLVVGGIAVGRYLPERTTSDIDILIRDAHAAQAARNLAAAGAHLCGALSIGGTSWTLGGIDLDVLTSRARWISRAFATGRSWQGTLLIDLPYLILMKLAAARHHDETDIAAMLAHASDDVLVEVRRVVAADAPERVEDLEAYLYIGRAEKGGVMR
jgi:hypothetical protein